jgi:hypothetical protein
MDKIFRIGMDTSKHVFQLHGNKRCSVYSSGRDMRGHLRKAEHTLEMKGS